MFKKIVVGISGGVDSAVTALLLKQKGFDVHGVYMKNWDEFDETGQCNGENDYRDAQIICNKLQIPLIQVNFVKDYWNNVFCNFLNDYEKGITPNPDILCNKYIKFDKFYEYARKNLNADAIATGHYARTSFGDLLENYTPDTNVKLLCAVDQLKDQTFFLSNIQQKALRKTMFPLGNYQKNDIKLMAKNYGLGNIAAKKESTGICFIGNRKFKEFITEYIDPKPGNFIDIDTGQIVGQHNGIHQWTIGQRCRLSGCLKPYFTLYKNIETNEIYVAAGTNHKSLLTQNLFTELPYWIDPSNQLQIQNSFRCQFRFQHTKPLVHCTINMLDNGLMIKLDQPLRAITPGQYAVFYLNNECLGNSRIIHTKFS